MKNIIAALMACLGTASSGYSQVITPQGNEGHTSGSWTCYRNSFEITDNTDIIELRLAADTKYWLWVNGTLEISEGGLKIGPNPKDTYCDVITDLKSLKKGKNEIAVLVWYFGKEGFSHKNSPTPGMTFDLSVNGKETEPENQWKYTIHPAYYTIRRKSELQTCRIQHRI